MGLCVLCRYFFQKGYSRHTLFFQKTYYQIWKTPRFHLLNPQVASSLLFVYSSSVWLRSKSYVMFTSVCKTTLLCFAFLMLGLCHRSMASCIITSQASGTIIKETFPSCYTSSNHHSVRVKCAPKPRVSLFPSLSAATSSFSPSSSSRKRNLRSVVRVVRAASATSEAENVQAEEEVLEQVGESRGGNIKADPLRIILFQVNKPYFVGNLSPLLLLLSAISCLLQVLKLYFLWLLT